MYKPIFTKIIDGLYLGDEEGLPEAERRGYSVLAACKDGSPDCHRAVLGYTELGAPKDKDYYFVQMPNNALFPTVGETFAVHAMASHR